MAKINLVKGQKIDITKGTNTENMMFGLGWDVNGYSGEEDFDLDVYAFLIGADGKGKQLVYWGNPNVPDGCVIYSGDNRTGEGNGDDETMKIFFNKVPKDIKEVVICVGIHDADNRLQNFGMVDNAYIRGVNDKGEEEFNYDLDEDFSTSTAVIAGKAYRHDNEWKFAAIGQGMDGWLPGLLKHFGMEA